MSLLLDALQTRRAKRDAQNKAPGAMGTCTGRRFCVSSGHHLKPSLPSEAAGSGLALERTHHRELPLPAHYLLNIGQHRSLFLSRGLPEAQRANCSRSPI